MGKSGHFASDGHRRGGEPRLDIVEFVQIMTAGERWDIYSEINPQLIAAIEADPANSCYRGANHPAPLFTPFNALTKNAHNGIKVVGLGAAAHAARVAHGGESAYYRPSTDIFRYLPKICSATRHPTGPSQATTRPSSSS